MIHSSKEQCASLCGASEVYNPKAHWIYEHCHFDLTNSVGEKMWLEWGSPNRPDWHAPTITRFLKDGGTEVIRL